MSGKTEVEVPSLPNCQFHPELRHPAEYDFRTKSGQWGFGCEKAWKAERSFSHLGTGAGHKLVVKGDGDEAVSSGA